jgi:uncharacterized membrane protein
MNGTLKKILVVVGITVVLGVAYSLYTWYKPHRDVQDETAVKVTAQAIFDAYKLYLDKAVVVSGEVSNVKTNQEGKTVVVIKTSDPMFGVQCTMKESSTVKPGELVELKGICTGYLMDVVLTDCYQVK